MLPIRQIPCEDFWFEDGQCVDIRGLSRAEALQLRTLGEDVTAIEIHCLVAGTGCTKEEAEAWHAATSSAEVEALINAIARLSGFDPDEGKAVAEDLPSANTTALTTSLPRT